MVAGETVDTEADPLDRPGARRGLATNDVTAFMSARDGLTDVLNLQTGSPITGRKGKRRLENGLERNIEPKERERD